MLLYLDITAGQFVLSPCDTRRVSPPAFTVGDTIAVTIAFLQRTQQPINTGVPVYQYVDMSSAGIVLSLGPSQLLPTAGSFTLSFGGGTTAALGWNVDQLTLAAALNALTSVADAGGVTVEGEVGGPFTITFGDTGSQDAMTVGANGLFPTSTITIETAQSGTSALAAVQVLTLEQSAAVQVSSWTAQGAAAVTVTQLSGYGYQRVQIPAGTYGGTFTLTYGAQTTAAIPWNAQLDVVESALEAIGLTGVTVWPGQNYWDITSSATSAFSGNAAGLIIPKTLTGSLALTAQNVADLLAGAASGSAPLLVQQTSPAVLTLFSGAAALSLP